MMARRGVVVTAAVVLSLCLLAFMLSDREDVSGVSETIRLRVGKWWRQGRQETAGPRPAVESKRAMLHEILTEKAQLKRILVRQDRKAKQEAELAEMRRQVAASAEQQDAKEALEMQRNVMLDEDEIEAEQADKYLQAEKAHHKAHTAHKARQQEKAQVRTAATKAKVPVTPKTTVVTTKHTAKLQQLPTAKKTETVQAKVAAPSEPPQTKSAVTVIKKTKVVHEPAVVVKKNAPPKDTQEIVMEPDYQAATAVVEGLPTKHPTLPSKPALKKAKAVTMHKTKKPVVMPPVPHAEKPPPEVVSPASGGASGHSILWYVIWGTVASLCFGIVAFVLCYACNLCQGQRSSPWGLPPKRTYR